MSALLMSSFLSVVWRLKNLHNTQVGYSKSESRRKTINFITFSSCNPQRWCWNLEGDFSLRSTIFNNFNSMEISKNKKKKTWEALENKRRNFPTGHFISHSFSVIVRDYRILGCHLQSTESGKIHRVLCLQQFSCWRGPTKKLRFSHRTR